MNATHPQTGADTLAPVWGESFNSINQENRALFRNGVKRCNRCLEIKPLSDFHLRRGGPSVVPNCKPCVQVIHKSESITASKVSSRLLYKYGITLAERDAMLAAQGGGCAACGTTDPGKFGWVVDHDHSCCPPRSKGCGKCVRGVLCHNCNIALGLVNDDVDRLRGLITYLEVR